MPPVSQAQRKAMRAAAAGKSTLGIPAKVGKEFDAADPGGKLPAKVKARKATSRSPAKGRSADFQIASNSQAIGSSPPPRKR